MNNFDDIVEAINGLLNEKNIPKNVRNGLMNAKNILSDSSKPINVRASLAIYELDKAVNDINISQHSRIKIMHLISELEARK